MIDKSSVAAFVAERIRLTGKAQTEIAFEAGFEKPNMITMIKQGKTKLPLAKIGVMAKSLETDPTHLLKLCLAEYQPETWAAISPYMEEMLTGDELSLLRSLRTWVGAPYLVALTENQRNKLDGFMNSMKDTSNKPEASH
ncbi:MAG: hypothetical protein Q8O38_09080 [Sulfurimicrobium sp.]|nr:hypothetical protein [Sulfurimicrobium sp.]